MRPQSAITGTKPRNLLRKTPAAPGISVRWTEAHHIAYLRLGGSKWLRKTVEAEMKKEAKQ